VAYGNHERIHQVRNVVVIVCRGVGVNSNGYWKKLTVRLLGPSWLMDEYRSSGSDAVPSQLGRSCRKNLRFARRSRGTIDASDKTRVTPP
jgi:hypothetical protein